MINSTVIANFIDFVTYNFDEPSAKAVSAIADDITKSGFNIDVDASVEYAVDCLIGKSSDYMCRIYCEQLSSYDDAYELLLAGAYEAVIDDALQYFAYQIILDASE